MKQKALVGLALAIAFAAGYGVWKLAVSVQKPSAQVDASLPAAVSSPDAASPANEVSARPSVMPSPTSLAPAALTAEVPLSPTSVAEIAKCIPSARQATATVRTLSEAYQALTQSQGGVTERTELRRNVHIALPNGEKRRIRLSPLEQGDAGPSATRVRSTKLQVFTEDAEGLPVPMQIPKSDSINPSPETVKSYLSMGKETYRESLSQLRLKSGATVDVHEENGFVRLLQVGTPGASLGCAVEEISHEADCQCLSQP
jgi:hypothetical protein